MKIKILDKEIEEGSIVSIKHVNGESYAGYLHKTKGFFLRLLRRDILISMTFHSSWCYIDFRSRDISSIEVLREAGTVEKS